MQLKSRRRSSCVSLPAADDAYLWGLYVLGGGWLVLGLSPQRTSAVRTGLELLYEFLLWDIHP